MDLQELHLKLYDLINNKVGELDNDSENPPYNDNRLYFLLKNYKRAYYIEFYKHSTDKKYPNHGELAIGVKNNVWMSIYFNYFLDFNKVYKILELILNNNEYLVYRILRNYKVMSSNYYYNYEKDSIGRGEHKTHITYKINIHYELVDITEVKMLDRIKLNTLVDLQ